MQAQSSCLKATQTEGSCHQQVRDNPSETGYYWSESARGPDVNLRTQARGKLTPILRKCSNTVLLQPLATQAPSVPRKENGMMNAWGDARPLRQWCKLASKAAPNLGLVGVLGLRGPELEAGMETRMTATVPRSFGNSLRYNCRMQEANKTNAAQGPNSSVPHKSLIISLRLTLDPHRPTLDNKPRPARN